MKRKLVAVALAVCTVGVVGVGGAAAHGAHPTKKKKPAPAHPAKKKAKKPASFDERFDCAKVAPAAWVTSLSGGYGGTLTLKPQASWTHVANYPANKGGVGGVSDCNYSQSAGWPGGKPTSEGPVEVKIAYGTHALWWYKAMHAGARSAVPLTGLGDEAFDNGNYVAALRGEVFVLVAVDPIPTADHSANVPVPAGLMTSIAGAVLAKLPAK